MARRRKRKKSELVAAQGSMVRRVSAVVSRIRMPERRVLRRSLVGAGWLASVSALIAAWALGVPSLQAFASHRNAVDPHNVTIRFLNQPAWVQGNLANMLLKTASMQIGGDPMVRDDLAAVRLALLDTGWFDSIAQVRRTQEDLVEIDARFVTPYTLVRDAEGDHLIDANARLLAMSFEHGVRLEKGDKYKFAMIAITGAHFARPRRVGGTWEGADIAAGLRLLTVIEQQPWRSQVKEIDVSGALRDQPLRLKTTTGCLIIWGGPPGEEPALEVLSAGKLERLNFFFKNYGRIDRGLTGELDITGEKVVVNRE